MSILKEDDSPLVGSVPAVPRYPPPPPHTRLRQQNVARTNRPPPTPPELHAYWQKTWQVGVGDALKREARGAIESSNPGKRWLWRPAPSAGLLAAAALRHTS
jgi:hypothetical protein